MVVDESGSITLHNLIKIKKFLANVVSRFSVARFGAHFGLVKYSTDPRLVFSLDKYTNTRQLQESIRNMVYLAGGTKTGRAFEYTRKNVRW